MIEFSKYLQKENSKPKAPMLDVNIHACDVGSGYNLLEWAKNEIIKAPDGKKHSTLIRVAYTLGGYVAGGTISESEAFNTCLYAIKSHDIESEYNAKKTIEDGLREGRKKPLASNQIGMYELQIDNNPIKQFQLDPTIKATGAFTQSPQERYEALEQYRFNSEHPVERPEAIISIKDHIISTKGNVTTIAGQAKAGKSAIIAAILAGALAIPGDVQPDLLGFTIKGNINGKAVLHIDGEQSRYDHYKGMIKLLKRTSRSKEPDWFYSYNFKVLDIAVRRAELLFIASEVAAKHDGIHMIVLDGGADFILDTNDLKESNEVVKSFETLAIEFNCPVVIVLHFNPGSEKGRGHFGSQLERKCESIISVSKDKNSEVSTIEGKFLRNSGIIPNLQFIYDVEKGHHVFYGGMLKQNNAEVKANELRSIAEGIFIGGNESFTYTELWKKIMLFTGLKERSAKDYVSKMKISEIIEHSKNNEKYTLKSLDQDNSAKVQN